MIYEVEIDVNVDSDYNAIVAFDNYAEAVAFAKILVDRTWTVKIRGAFDDEE